MAKVPARRQPMTAELWDRRYSKWSWQRLSAHSPCERVGLLAAGCPHFLCGYTLALLGLQVCIPRSFEAYSYPTNVTVACVLFPLIFRMLAHAMSLLFLQIAAPNMHLAQQASLCLREGQRPGMSHLESRNI